MNGKHECPLLYMYIFELGDSHKKLGKLGQNPLEMSHVTNQL